MRKRIKETVGSSSSSQFVTADNPMSSTERTVGKDLMPEIECILADALQAAIFRIPTIDDHGIR